MAQTPMSVVYMKLHVKGRLEVCAIEPLKPLYSIWDDFKGRCMASMCRRTSDCTKWVRIFKSMVAPKLSELDTNMYFTP